MRRFSTALGAPLVVALCLCTSAAQAAPRLSLSGPVALSEAKVKRFLGRPSGEGEALDTWAREAVAKVIKFYWSQGYPYVRAWYLIEDETVRLHVDEGKMHRIILKSGGSDRRLLFQVDLSLPDGIFHGPTLEAGLNEIRVRHRFSRLIHEVDESTATYENPLGFRVPERILTVRAVSEGDGPKLSEGVSFRAGADAEFGLNVRVGVDSRDLLSDDDHLHLDAVLALPYEQFLFAEAPKYTFVKAETNLAYRFPRLGETGLMPLADNEARLSYISRPDRGLQRVMIFSVKAQLGLNLQLSDGMAAAWLVGASFLSQHDVQGVPDYTGVTPDDESLVRIESRLSFYWVDKSARRSDLRSELFIYLRGALAEGGGRLGDVSSQAQVVTDLGGDRGNYLIFRTNAFTLLGDVLYFDERAVSSRYHRVYFRPAYWVRHAAQLEVAYRQPILAHDQLSVGVFHDVSVFANEQREGEITLANAFGPSIHVLLFDFLAIDLYQGFGFSPQGFENRFTFQLRTVY